MILALLLAAAVAAACTALRHRLDRPERRESLHLGGRVRLTGMHNRGSAFGLLHLSRKCLAGVSLVVLVVSLPLCRRSRVGCGLLLGGGASNLCERLGDAGVFDYIQFPKAPGRMKRYVYNLADFAIFLGALLISLSRKTSFRH